MKVITKARSILLLCLTLLSAAPLFAQSNAFLFQGTLQDNGAPANGLYDITFQLFDASTNGTSVTGIISGNGLAVNNGQFSAILDFGDVFNGSDRWMELTARTNGVGSFTTISPRQQITAVASALIANKAISLVNGSSIVNPSFIGTTNGTPLEFYANNQRVLRIEPANDPNLIGGNAGNYVAPGVSGATISGGGSAGFTNRVLSDFATISGGKQNRADGYGTAIGGGEQNTASGQLATVPGGYGNRASGDYSIAAGNQNLATNTGAVAIGGILNRAYGTNSFVVGATNIASGNNASVVGGVGNSAIGNYSVVAGGLSNSATGDFSFAAGRRAQANHKGVFIWADSFDTNYTSTSSNQFLVRASGGAIFNATVTASNFVGSGAGLTNIGVSAFASNAISTAAIANGAVTASKIGTNQVVKSLTVVPSTGPSVTMRDDVVLLAGANIDMVSSSNMIQISASSNGVIGWATSGNIIDSNDFIGTISSQPLEFRVNSSRALLIQPTAGTPNIVSGNANNSVGSNAVGSTVLGGGSNAEPNSAGGSSATAIGGTGNSAAGNYSFATGHRAKANHTGTTVFADSTSQDFTSTGNDQFLIRANGGVGINTANPGPGVALNVNGVFSAKSYASNQIVKSISAGGVTNKDDVKFLAGANVSIVANGNSIEISANSPGNIGWATEGNIGTTTNNFIGTADNAPLEFRVNSGRALRIEPTVSTPNLIGGSLSNSIVAGSVGATIVGGGVDTNANRVGGNFATVLGGAGNSATGNYSAAAGNRAKAGHAGSFVWADASDVDFASTSTNQFLIRAGNGVGIGTNKPASALHVVGTVTADAFVGSLQSSIDASQITGVLADARLSSNIARLNGNAAFTGSVSATSLAGSGANITSLNASNLTTGTVADARLSTNVARLNGNAAFTGSVSATSLTGSGANITSLNAANITTGTLADARLSANVARLNADATFTGDVVAATLSGSGANITGLNATNITAGTIADARLSANVPRLSGSAAFNGSVTATSFTGSGANITSLNAANLSSGTLSDARLSANVARLNSDATFTGDVVAATLSGSGANITGLNGANLSTGIIPDARLSANIPRLSGGGTFAGSIAATSLSGNINATNLVSGTLADARLSSNIPRLSGGATFAGAVQATSFTGSGANVSNLNASAISSGTLPDSRLSGNVVMQNSSPTFAAAIVANNGQAQGGTYVVRQQTQDAVLHELFVDGVGQRLSIPNNTTVAFDILVAGRSSTGLSAAFQIRGVISNNNGTVALGAAPLVTPLKATKWKATATAGVGQSLAVKVVGALNTTINWSATIHTSEVSF